MRPEISRLEEEVNQVAIQLSEHLESQGQLDRFHDLFNKYGVIQLAYVNGLRALKREYEALLPK